MRARHVDFEEKDAAIDKYLNRFGCFDRSSGFSHGTLQFHVWLWYLEQERRGEKPIIGIDCSFGGRKRPSGMSKSILVFQEEQPSLTCAFLQRFCRS